MVEIGIHCLQGSQHPDFWWRGGHNFSFSSKLFTPRLCAFGSQHPYHSSLTVPMSHYMYAEWWYMVEIGIHCLQWSLITTHWLLIERWSQFQLQFPTFHTQIVCIWITTSISQQLDCSNVSLGVWWMMRQGRDWSSFITMVTASWLLSHGEGKFWHQAPHFPNQDCVILNPYNHFTAAWLFQCLIRSMMSDETR